MERVIIIKMKKQNWIWMPHAGHLIVSNSCRFHLFTYVGNYVVSTVGEYWPDRLVREIHAEIYDSEWLKENRELKGDDFDSAYFKKFGFMAIGAGEKDIYETMVFKARKSENKCCPYEMVSGELECIRYATAEDACKGHLRACYKWGKKNE